jgi:pimeloyl-ACP methyl ester carboxylesterase
MDRLKIERAHIAGYSLGRRIATMLLADLPERLRTAVIGRAGWMNPASLRVRKRGWTKSDQEPGFTKFSGRPTLRTGVPRIAGIRLRQIVS